MLEGDPLADGEGERWMQVQVRGGTIEHNWEKFHVLQPGDVFVEVGGFWGRYAVRAARRKCAKVVLIEPAPDNQALIEQAIKEEALENIVILIKKAVSDHKGTAQFIVEGNPSGWRIDNSGGTLPTITVETDTLEGILDSLGIDHVDLLGSDCEFGEADMLRYAGKWLKEHRIKYIGIEAHGKEMADACIELLKAAGYSILAVEAAGAIIYAKAP